MFSVMRPSRRKNATDMTAPLGRETILRDDDVSVFKIERRREPRAKADGRLPASYTNGTNRCGITYLDVLDRSPSGMGVLTRSPIEPGMTVTISPDGKSAPWMRAVAVRCTRAGEMFRVGVRFSRLAAA